MDFLPNLRDLLIILPPILLALTFHEYAHGYTAFKLGDPTAKNEGRLTLNPLAHLDPLGTILLILVHFGWAKPVPVDPRYFQNPRRDMMWVAIAGPGSNVIIALVVGLIMQVTVSTRIVYVGTFEYTMLAITVYINLILAFFNMLPIPPLDGSRVVAGLLPYKYLPQWYAFERIGGLVLMGLIVIGMVTGIRFFSIILLPTHIVYRMFTGGLPSPF